MPNEDKDLIPGFDVQVIPVSANGAPVPTQSTAPNVPGQGAGGNGYILTSAPNTPIIVVPPQQPQPPQQTQPSLVVITLAPKKEEKKEKKTSSVFQRL
jgi:hypothetical protein